MIKTLVEFFPQNEKNIIFRIVRTPETVKAHVLFLQGLFEDMNINRSAFTQAAMLFSENEISSIIFDYYGTGDSEGDIKEATLKDWQENITDQLLTLKSQSDKPIIIVAFASAALLINDEITAIVKHVQLWQPQVSGAFFIKQMERLALLASEPLSDNDCKEIVGYQINNELWCALKNQQYTPGYNKKKFIWFEFVDDKSKALMTRRQNQINLWVSCDDLLVIEEEKYWLSSNIVVPKSFINLSLQSILEVI